MPENTTNHSPTIYLKDYVPTSYQVENVDLTFDIYPEKTIVTQKANYKVRSATDVGTSLVLNGESLKLISVKYQGESLGQQRYELTDKHFIFYPNLESFQLEFVTEIYPEKNHALEGLYFSSGMYCTQNEAEGFRKITYYYDRPDVLTTFSTKVIASKSYPFLLANGNCVEKGDSQNNRHWARWVDPFPKPSYLFALVAGDFDLLTDNYTTMSGRTISLEIFVDHGSKDQAYHAMESLKKSMRWDEQTFGLEYDLDVYMVVAVRSFNMGAMENKGLNIFNSKYVLGNLKTATDDDLYGIESVIAHEYFHNYTGNRVTCRDWFQLTLKEGLTVFRDQEFSADTHCRFVQRISDVSSLRTHQFTEDDSSFAHPIKPKSYQEINNFYTMTVYEKGAEVIRMMQTLIGKEHFIKGTQRYLKDHDGTGATTEDFVAAMQAQSSFDFRIFKNWYDVKGTPIVHVQKNYDAGSRRCYITLKQSFKDSTNRNIMCIPLRFACFQKTGEDYQLTSISPTLEADHSFLMDDIDSHGKTLVFQDQEVRLVFDKVETSPVFSINRNFSAPVKLDYDLSLPDIKVVALYETDFFSKWEMVQTLIQKLMKKSVHDTKLNEDLVDDIAFILKSVLANEKMSYSLKALFLKFPTEKSLGDLFDVVPFDEIHSLYKQAKKLLSLKIYSEAMSVLKVLPTENEDVWSSEQMGLRSLRWVLVDWLMVSYDNFSEHQEYLCDFVARYFSHPQNMTNEVESLKIASQYKLPNWQQYQSDFFHRWSNHALVVDKYIQARVLTADLSEILGVLNEIRKASYFNIKVPNNVRALIGPWILYHPATFHKQDGSGYHYLKEMILEIDGFNPQLASRLSKMFVDLRKLDSTRREHAREVLEELCKHKLSSDTQEVISKYLN